MLRKAFTVLLAATTLAACDGKSDRSFAPGGPGDNAGAPENFQLQLLHFADVDGGGTAAMFNVDQFSALVEAFRSDMPERTLLLSSGDNYIPGPIFQASSDGRLDPVIGGTGGGRGETAIQNRLGLQASAVGNHDLDPGPGGLVSIIAPDGDYPGATFPYLSANIDFTTDSATAPLFVEELRQADTLQGKLARSTFITVDGERIGIVGAVTPTLPAITSVGNLTLLPPDFTEDEAGFDALAAVIQESVDVLLDDGIDKIILLAHMQRIAVERALATRLRGVDIIVAGGSNTLLADSNDFIRDGDNVGGEYPQVFSSPDGEPVLLVNTDADYKYLGRLVVEFDDNGVIVLDSLDTGINGAWAATDTIVDQVGGTAIPEVVEIADVVRTILGEQDGSAFGITDVFLDGRRAFVRSRETNLGNLTADANLWYGQQLSPENPPVVSVKNGGGIRAPIGLIARPEGSDEIQLLPPAANDFGKPEGGISQLDIQTALAFNNGLALVDMTAAELHDLVEEMILGNFTHTAGLRVEFDNSFPPRDAGDTNLGAGTNGERVRRLEVVFDDDTTDLIVENGALQGDPGRSFRVLALDFLANCAAPPGDPAATPNCGSGWPFNGLADPDFAVLERSPLAERDPGNTDFSNTGGEQDAFAEYLQQFHATPENAFSDPIDINERLIPLD